MNFADFGLGTWHPKKGMYSVVKGIVKLAKELGVEFYENKNVHKILVENNKTRGIMVNNVIYEADVILSGADYHHTENLLNQNLQ